jgi:hypothetical protein
LDNDRQTARELGVGAVLASLSLGLSFAALGVASIGVSRIIGPDATGLLALSNQVILITIFVAGIGLRTSLAAMIGAGEWSVRTGVRSALAAALLLGPAGALLGLAVYELLRDSALDGFSLPMALALMACLPTALLWWIVPAVALGKDRYEAYALLTISAPVGVMVLSPIGALVVDSSGVVYGLAAGYVIGGLVCAAWGLGLASRSAPREGEPGVTRAVGRDCAPGSTIFSRW